MSLLVCSYGGGRNSCAGLIGLRQRDIVPDRIQFSDTGVFDAEKPETYAHIALMDRWCAEHGFPPITVVRVGDSEKAVDKSLYDNCYRLGFMPSIVYGFKKCSQRWKADPQAKDLRNWEPARAEWDAGRRIRRAIFYDAGEGRRAVLSSDERTEFWFPLIEWGWTLERCVQEIDKAGIPQPPKSACFFCPSSRKKEVLALKREHPDLYEKAVALERNAAQKTTTIRGLGRHWSWEELGKADEVQLSMFCDNTQDVPCMCFDGEDEDAA